MITKIFYGECRSKPYVLLYIGQCTGGNQCDFTKPEYFCNKYFYIRFTSATECPSTGVLTINLKSPKNLPDLLIKSYVLNDTTTLDAGAGFTSYLWSTGATTQSIIAGAGNYYVDLDSTDVYTDSM
jgi:hypothetical protein